MSGNNVTHECEDLDAFLADDLPPNAAKRFAAHLAQCAACREATEQQRWIDGLLKSPLREELESPPAAVASAVRASIVRRHRRVRVIAGGVAAAAAILLAAGWIALWKQPDHRVAKQSAVALRDAAEPSPGPSRRGTGAVEPPRATFVGDSDLIVVPVASRVPSVTIVRVYPTYQAEHAEDAGDRTVSELPAFDDSTWTDSFNGG